MIIRDVRVTPIAIADPPLRSSYGLHQPYALRTIIEVVSEEGVVGIGEAHGGSTAEAAFTLAGSRVVGRDAFELARLRGLIDADFSVGAAASADRSHAWLLPGENPADQAARVFGGFEVAILDPIGKSIGRPVCDLLGGRVRDRVPFSAYLFYKHSGGGGAGVDARHDTYGEAMTPDAVVEQARAMIARHGFASVKLKAGVLPPEVEVETIERLWATLGPDVPLRIDPNSAWSLATALAVGRRLTGRLEYLEDPVDGLEGMARLRAALLAEGIDLPLASNVAVTGFADLPEAVERDAVQIVLGDHHFWGGLRAITELGRVCSTMRLGLSMHSNSHLGVSLMAMAHVAAATPAMTFACDTHYPWIDPADEIIEGGPVQFDEGSVVVPNLPGLGVTLDPDALARAAERYRSCGYVRRDDVAEMRAHVDPAWERRIPTF